MEAHLVKVNNLTCISKTQKEKSEGHLVQ